MDTPKYRFKSNQQGHKYKAIRNNILPQDIQKDNAYKKAGDKKKAIQRKTSFTPRVSSYSEKRRINGRGHIYVKLS